MVFHYTAPTQIILIDPVTEVEADDSIQSHLPRLERQEESKHHSLHYFGGSSLDFERRVLVHLTKLSDCYVFWDKTLK